MNISRGLKHIIGIAAAVAVIGFGGSAMASLVDHYEFEGYGVGGAAGDVG